MFLIKMSEGVVSLTGGMSSLKPFEDGFLDNVVWWCLIAARRMDFFHGTGTVFHNERKQRVANMNDIISIIRKVGIIQLF